MLLQKVRPSFDDKELVGQIAQARVKAYLLKKHLETFPAECARGGGGHRNKKRGFQKAAPGATPTKKTKSNAVSATTPRVARNRDRVFVDHLLDGGSMSTQSTASATSRKRQPIS